MKKTLHTYYRLATPDRPTGILLGRRATMYDTLKEAHAAIFKAAKDSDIEWIILPCAYVTWEEDPDPTCDIDHTPEGGMVKDESLERALGEMEEARKVSVDI